MQKIKFKSAGLLRWLIALLLLSWVGYYLDLQAIFERIQGFDPDYGVAMLLLNLSVLLLMALRWKIIAGCMGVTAPYHLYLRGVWLGAFSAQFGPAIIFSELARYKVLQGYAGRWQLLSSQLLDRLSGLFALFVIVILLSPWSLEKLGQSALPRILAPLFIMLVLLLLLFCIYQYRKITGKGQALVFLALKPFTAAKHFFLSLLIQTLLVLCFALAVLGLGLGQQSQFFMLLMPLVLFSLSLLPLSVADWGSRETIALLLLSASGLSAETIIAASLIYGAMNAITALLGVFFLLNNPKKSLIIQNKDF